ncbi:MAG: hypothetical protein QNI84_11630 [Henriciella sp.]|nr:hypothetical protein [Henriciella sp.]
MIRKLLAGLAAGMSLVACGGADESETTLTAEAPPIIADTNDVVEESTASPGTLPPAETYAQDGDVITGKVGEEFSFKLDVPDGSSTAVNWSIAEGSYEPIASYDKTWRALEGSTRYSEIVLVGAEAGETTVTFHMVDGGQPVDGVPTRTLTFRVSG